MVKVIAFFNNKGGVGKTTLAVNIASYLSIGFQKKVLFIDADPQSNSTQMILSDETLDKIYKKKSKSVTLLSYLDPILKDELSIDLSHIPLSSNSNRFSVDLIPGHPRISLIEDTLSEAWNDCGSGKVGGFRVTNWLKSLTDSLGSNYDFIIIDLGPSLGALNRSVLMNSDYFVAPMGCDIFSLMGIENISNWITDWREIYKMGLVHLKKRFPDEYETYPIEIELSNKFRLAGFSVQQYITKVIDGKRRGIKAYEDIMKKISDYVDKNLSEFFSDNCIVSDLDLGYIPHLYSLVPLAQTHRCPIHALDRSDGIVGNHYKMIEDYRLLMNTICKKIIYNVGGNNE